MPFFHVRFLALELSLLVSGSAVGSSLRSAPALASASMASPGALPIGLSPVGMNKQVGPLPEQGFNEIDGHEMVQHTDYGSIVSDWRRERPRQEGEEDEGDSTTRACEDHPDYLWCNLWLKDRARRALGPRIVHKIKEVTVSRAGDERVSDRVERRKQERAASEQRRAEAKAETEEKAQKAEKAKSLSGWEKGLRKTGDQAGDTTDELSAVLPRGMWRSQGDVKGKESTEEKEREGNFPPGMASESGGPSPYEPASFGASLIPAIANSVVDLW